MVPDHGHRILAQSQLPAFPHSRIRLLTWLAFLLEIAPAYICCPLPNDTSEEDNHRESQAL
ncbi:MAG: hypothetical protein CSA31_02565 [Desulfobulbus propionicus]|nr:MAG: hypothetical protein CSA31_02565 [Desulfobulbus propionicus]